MEERTQQQHTFDYHGELVDKQRALAVGHLDPVLAERDHRVAINDDRPDPSARHIPLIIGEDNVGMAGLCDAVRQTDLDVVVHHPPGVDHLEE